MRWLLVGLLIVAVLLHQDFWLWTDRTLVFGFLPIGLAYHIAYSLGAAALMGLLVRYMWPAHLEESETASPGAPASEVRA